MSTTELSTVSPHEKRTSDTFRRLGVAVGVLAGLPGGAAAQGFEGLIRTRTISVQPSALERLGATTPEHVFALPIERILALQSTPDEDAGVQVTVEEEGILSIKGSMIRMKRTDVSDTTWYWIIDLERGTWLAVQPSRRRYAELAASDEPAEEPPSTPGRADRAVEGARPLGATRTFIGVRATGYEVRSEFEIARGWMSTQQDLAALARAFQKLGAMWEEPDDPDQGPDAEEILLAHGFPMLTQTLEVEDGQLGGYQIEETVSVERKPMPASLFAVPAGYRKVSLEELLAEMQRREP